MCYFGEGKARFGFNMGLGVTEYDGAAVLLYSAALFIQIREGFRIDGGYMRAISAKETLDKTTRDRDAFYAGVSFPTKINDLFKR